MSRQDLARRAKAQVAFDGADITGAMEKYLLSLTYTDSEEDEADDLQIKLQDREGLWLEKWIGAALEGSSETIGDSVNRGGAVYTVTAKSGLCVRTGPGKKYKRLTALPCGTAVTVTGWENGWGMTDYNGTAAYVYGGFLREGGKVGGSAGTAYSAMSIEASILALNWTGDGKDALLDCGEFELDSIRRQEPPSTVTFKGTSLPYSSTIRQTKKTRVWESYRLSQIAGQIGAEHGMTCMFESAYDPLYERVEQYKDSDIAFLSTLCHNAGISLKATRRILVLFDQAAYESKSAVFTIRRTRRNRTYIKSDLAIGTADTKYESCRVRYADPLTGRCIEGIAYSEEYVAKKSKDDGEAQRLEITAKVSTEEEARTLAAKMLRMHNKFQRTASFTMPGNPKLVAGVTVELERFGPWSGKYMVRQAVHSLSASGGYTTQISLRRVLEGY